MLYSAAMLAQCLFCEQKGHLKNTLSITCERERGIHGSNAQLGAPNNPAFQTSFSGLKCLLFALFTVLPGKGVPQNSCVLSVDTF